MRNEWMNKLQYSLLFHSKITSKLAEKLKLYFLSDLFNHILLWFIQCIHPTDDFMSLRCEKLLSVDATMTGNVNMSCRRPFWSSERSETYCSKDHNCITPLIYCSDPPFYETLIDKDVFNTEEMSTVVGLQNTNKCASAIYIHPLTYSCNFMSIHLPFPLCSVGSWLMSKGQSRVIPLKKIQLCFDKTKLYYFRSILGQITAQNLS